MLKLGRRYSRILVTGGAGFIGSHIVDRLLEEGFEVIVLDDLSSGNMENVTHCKGKAGFDFVQGDIRNATLVRKTVCGVDAVFHEAALVSVGFSVENPVVVSEVNVQGTLNLLKASSDAGVKRFIYASSASVYGDAPFLKVSEEAAPKPISPLGASKLASEHYLRAFFETYGLETVCLRYFNVFGPRQSFDPKFPYSGVITIFLNRLLDNVAPTIYGDGTQTRDFVYIQDVVEANLLALQSEKAAAETFNVGCGRGISINHVASALKKALNKSALQCICAERRPSDIEHSCADISKAQKILGYNPKYSFDKGIKTLVTWYLALRAKRD